MERIEHHVSFAGRQEVWKHHSDAVLGAMKFAIYLPPAALRGEPCPVLYWLSGLTCTEQNFITKGGAQQFAAAQGLIVVAPDTSPRGPDVADDPAYDLGQGAGFYVNATEAPWSKHFRMEDYVVHELPALVDAHFSTTGLRGIAGHSMGGHGALTLALKHPGRYASVSAIAPIVAPSEVPWGQKAFTAYLGNDRAKWLEHDSVALVAHAREKLPLLVDQGDADEFLARELQPERLLRACDAAQHPLTLRRHAGSDHSFYFIASVIGDHVAHHTRALRAT